MKDINLPSISRQERVILELLLQSRSKPMFGLEIVEKSDEVITRGAVYVMLSRMQDKGLVTSEQAPPDERRGGIPKRLYRPTGLAKLVMSSHAALARKLSLQGLLSAWA